MTSNEYRNNAMQMKGEVIDQLSVLEYLITFIICRHMSKDNLQFGMKVLNKLNFNTKIELFKDVMKEKGIDSNTNYPNLAKHISKMQSVRNNFAHSIIEIEHKQSYKLMDKFTLKTARFAEDKKETKITYSYAEHSRMLILLSHTMTDLTNISSINSFKINNKKILPFLNTENINQGIGKDKK